MNRVRLTHSLALLTTGLLAGAFGYGAANLAPTFRRVPLQMRLEFHTDLMRNNSVSMQLTMALAALSCVALAALTSGRPRLLAALSGTLVVASFVITRFGNVPINHQINRWVTEGAPTDYAEILTRWDYFHYLRTGTALIAFALMIFLALRVVSRESDAGMREMPVAAAT
ncbi:anthrone oxygenase family protein [Nocardia brasiliensis]|uniref:anthrone oxygenase family protein n=1 Tax=Nocardia brasiliensis TaxID=37326 RepID=UPI0036728EF8